MSYYNPKVYNYSNLDNENKFVIDRMIDMVDVVENQIDYLETQETDSIIRKAMNEIKIDCLKDTLNKMKLDIIEMIVGLIENQEEDVVEKDTNDYFFGYEYDEDKYVSHCSLSDEEIKEIEKEVNK